MTFRTVEVFTFKLETPYILMLNPCLAVNASDSNTTFDERNLYIKALRISILSIFYMG